mmetsp:Transcript_13465/g.24371  ORF Transcript_13465/g.24371 Transcript_13465/m.24371 type:complete len:213 (+) Transcript_13465:327-965(+)
MLLLSAGVDVFESSRGCGNPFSWTSNKSDLRRITILMLSRFSGHSLQTIVLMNSSMSSSNALCLLTLPTPWITIKHIESVMEDTWQWERTLDCFEVEDCRWILPLISLLETNVLASNVSMQCFSTSVVSVDEDCFVSAFSIWDHSLKGQRGLIPRSFAPLLFSTSVSLLFESSASRSVEKFSLMMRTKLGPCPRLKMEFFSSRPWPIDSSLS